MKIQVINLPKRVDRLENVKNQLKGIEYSIFPAKVGEKTEKFTAGMVGIFNTSIEIYKEIVKSNELTLILEDDIKVCHNFRNKLNNLEKLLPKEFDMCFIGYNASLGKNNKTIIDENFCKISKWWGYHGYIINRSRAARKILSLLERDKMLKQVDNQIAGYGYNKLLDLIFLNKQLLIQEGFGTDIQTQKNDILQEKEN